uniref:Uncharacterized protein n=1 Tax=Proteus vulgaris TaxID=585 RepID=Q8KK86_PROVU|nr:hypothetical protein [Proteus vulgaris]
MMCCIPFKKEVNLSLFFSGKCHRRRALDTPLLLVNKTNGYSKDLEANRHDDVTAVITEPDFHPC